MCQQLSSKDASMYAHGEPLDSVTVSTSFDLATFGPIDKQTASLTSSTLRLTVSVQHEKGMNDGFFVNRLN